MCKAVLVPAIEQSKSVTQTHGHVLFFRFSPRVSPYRAVTRVPCTNLQVLISYLSYIQ